MNTYWSQEEFDIRFEWGLDGMQHLTNCDAIIIVDILSFSTCVDIAVGRGAVVYPWGSKDETVADFARSVGAELAGSRNSKSCYSLSPATIEYIPPGTKLVLPSPNGSALSLASGHIPTYAACLRNARAVARAARQHGPRINVIGAGERWPDGSLRPAIEDMIGSGAVIRSLPGTRSVEAASAAAVFKEFGTELLAVLMKCGSGQELVHRGFTRDVELAATLNCSNVAPKLMGGAYSTDSC